MSELKPCPFCGGEAVIRFQMGSQYISPNHKRTCIIKPNTWLISTKKINEQIEAWNNRNDDTDAIEHLMKELDAKADDYEILAKMYSKLNEDLCVRTKERDAAVAELKSVDAVPVVRCRDCKCSVDYYNDGECYCRRPDHPMEWIEGGWDWFCADGRLKEGSSNGQE